MFTSKSGKWLAIVSVSLAAIECLLAFTAFVLQISLGDLEFFLGGIAILPVEILAAWSAPVYENILFSIGVPGGWIQSLTYNPYVLSQAMFNNFFVYLVLVALQAALFYTIGLLLGKVGSVFRKR
jgi:quinol-cytochrome oxidoreductase complex cytochrome b subunit